MAPTVADDLREALAPAPAALLAALAAIGLTEAEPAEVFLNRDPGRDDPFALADMDRAVDRLQRAIDAGQPIAVYGDYDADGVTATALLDRCLSGLGGQVLHYIPHREREGYGVHARAIESLARDGARVLITVDCGIRADEELDLAERLGMDVIVTDHHALPESLPKALAVINPRRPDCPYPDQDLAGVGLAYKLAQGLLRVSAALGRSGGPSEAMLLDLVALGTVADVVPLLGENRSLVHRGLQVLRRAERPGIRALCEEAGVEAERIDAGSIGFVLGPRINAAGRMDDARLALDLLLAPDLDSARPLARRLESLNAQRRKTMDQALDAALARIDQDADLPSFLFDVSPDLPVGLLGLVAGRLRERYYRPAAVLRLEGDFARGSARSIPELDLIAALDAESGLLERHGGHAQAAGFRLATEDIPRLQSALCARAGRALDGLDLRPRITIAAEVAPEEIDRNLLAALERLGPFGQSNAKPILLWRDAPIGHARRVGGDGRHLKLVLEGGPRAGSIDAIAFGRGEDEPQLGPTLDLAFELEVNHWQGRERLQLMVRDLAAPGTPVEPSI